MDGRLSKCWALGVALLALASVPAAGQAQPACAPRPTLCPPVAIPEGQPLWRPDQSATPQAPGTQAPAAAEAPALPGALSGAVGTEGVALASNVGYIDSAIPRTELRLRYDAAYNDNRPDRAEFFYPKCGCFRNAGPFQDPKAPGPPKPETSIDFQDISAYLEVASGNRLSGFVELPVRFLNPDQNDNANGFADMNAGVKVALLAEEDTFLTFQLRGYFPTGDAGRGLGTDHFSLEPALLGYLRLTERLALESEFRDWIPLDGTDFAGNVLRYGVGLGYDVVQSSKLRVTPVAELVGWTVLNGKEFSPVANGGLPQDAAGDTIVNAKLGVRFGLGDAGSLYLGYGRALTGDVWYKDIYRIEYRLAF